MICIGNITGGVDGRRYFSGSCFGLINSSSLRFFFLCVKVQCAKNTREGLQR